RDSKPTLDPLDGDQPTEEPADDGSPGNERARLPPVPEGRSRILQQRQEAAPHQRAHRCSRKNPPAVHIADDVTGPTAKSAVSRKADTVGQGLEHPMSWDPPGAENDLDRKVHADPKDGRARGADARRDHALRVLTLVRP